MKHRFHFSAFKGAIHSQRNPLLVQAIIANQLERINQSRMNRANSVPAMGPNELEQNQQLSHG